MKPPAADARSHSLMVGGVLLVTLLVYLRSLAGGFVLDDHGCIDQNHYIGRWSFFLRSLTSDAFWFFDPAHPWLTSSYYRPLTDTWFGLNFHLFGLNPMLWHAAVVAVHLVVVWLVFELAQSLTRDRWTALLAALLFGVLPIHADAVSWISGVQLSLSAALQLGALLLFVRRAQPARWNFVLSLAMYGAALLTHEGAVIFPLLVGAYVLLLDRNVSDAEDLSVSQLYRSAIVTAPFLALTAVYLVIRLLALGFISRPFPFAYASDAQMFLTIPNVTVTYLELLAFPWMAGPAHRILFVSAAGSREFVVPVIVLAAVGALVVALLAASLRRRLYLFCGVWVVLFIAPMLDLRALLPDLMVQDRYLYMSSVVHRHRRCAGSARAMVSAWALHRLGRHRRRHGGMCGRALERAALLAR